MKRKFLKNLHFSKVTHTWFLRHFRAIFEDDEIWKKMKIYIFTKNDFPRKLFKKCANPVSSKSIWMCSFDFRAQKSIWELSRADFKQNPQKNIKLFII